jgi:hypothetical protein
MMTDPTPDDGRDDFVLQERLSGRSVRSLSKELRCSIAEIHSSLDRTLPTIDNPARLRHISLDLSRLDRLLETFHKRAIEKEDTQAALCVVKILERKAALLGLDSPQKVDIVQLQTQKQPSQHERITEAINRLWEQQPPAKKALHARLDQMTPERALELLGPLEPDANGNGSDHS